MDFLLVKDSNLNLDLEKAASILNTLTETVHFIAYDKSIDIASITTHIDFDKEKASLLNGKILLASQEILYQFLFQNKYQSNF